jgi:hypothetical protein
MMAALTPTTEQDMPSQDKINEHTIDLGTLLDQLNGLPRDTRISFGGLDFYRVKPRGPALIQIEFNQSVYRTTEGLLVVEDHSQ